ncbi:MAG: 16S rRNA (cytosine(967)-C(5))-methyltransferase RsmB [Bacteroidota bacterium]
MQLPSLLGHVQELLSTILTSDKPADSLIDSFFRSRKYLGSHDRRFIAETTYGTLRHLRRARAALDFALADSNATVRDTDRVLLTVASYLLSIELNAELNHEALTPKIQSAELKRRLPEIVARMTSFRLAPSSDPLDRMGIRYSFPDWLVKSFIHEFGETEAETLCAGLNEQAPLTLRVNALMTTVEECQRILQSEGIETSRTRLSPLGLNVAKRFNIFSLKSFRDGFFEVQDEGSQLVPLIIDPKPTAKVLDACAGAGGKTLALASIMKNRGEIYAADVHGFRLKELHRRATRAGVSNVRIKEVDDLAELMEKYSGFFDIVFIDAPCSGLGTIRRNPGMKWTVTEETVKELSEKQQRIIESSAPLVKSGGRLVYATCTVLREENENVVERFLSEHSGFTMIDPAPSVAQLGLSSAISGKFIKLLPHRHGTDGFFCAMMEKK